MNAAKTTKNQMYQFKLPSGAECQLRPSMGKLFLDHIFLEGASELRTFAHQLLDAADDIEGIEMPPLQRPLTGQEELDAVEAFKLPPLFESNNKA